MYSRKSAGSPLRILAGVLSIGVVVAAFAIYQVARPLLNAPSPATLPPTLIVLRPSAAPSATQPGPIFRIISDKAGLSTQLTELYYAVNADTWDLSHLGSLAGHLQGTANFGDGRNVVLAGHVELKDGVRGPFADLHRLAPGDPITILNDARPQPKVIQYTVTQVRKVKPDDFDVIRNHGYEELTLITCDDWNAQQSTYLSRIIVHARPVAALVTAAATGKATASVAATKTPQKK